MCVCINWRYPWIASTGFFFIIASRLGVRSSRNWTGLELGLYSWAGILQYSQYSRTSFFRPCLGL